MILRVMTYMPGVVAYLCNPATGKKVSDMGDGLAHQWYLTGNGMLATGNYWGVALTRTWAVRELCKVLIASNRKRILKDACDRVPFGMPCP